MGGETTPEHCSLTTTTHSGLHHLYSYPYHSSPPTHRHTDEYMHARGHTQRHIHTLLLFCIEHEYSYWQRYKQIHVPPDQPLSPSKLQKHSRSSRALGNEKQRDCGFRTASAFKGYYRSQTHSQDLSVLRDGLM